ncbi:hypothetical protein I3F60_01500 [Streptomyces sp. MUM 136J]|uniref:hypothetical protein n=1 Tax=Streptomyces sp. MUM 136J TaxID=2791992 RepID=UPI001F03DB52|nr:hypothetical protein [Streptomyces sp. MUM 136J]MCH0567953.1 hypothetical protein [Streptomyces sp. MUM 136J]
MEDAIWWIDWIVAASIALVILTLTASSNGKPVATAAVALGFVALFLGFSVMPLVVRQQFYDSSGRIKSWKHIASLNVIGMAILLSSAVVGANVNGW